MSADAPACGCWPTAEAPPLKRPSLQRSGSMSTCQPFQSCTKEPSSSAGKIDGIYLREGNALDVCRRRSGGAMEWSLWSVAMPFRRRMEMCSLDLYIAHAVTVVKG